MLLRIAMSAALIVLSLGSPASAATEAAAQPVAVDDVINVTAGMTFTLAAPGVLANDQNVPPNAGAGWQTLPPAGLMLNGDGGIAYQVPKNASGTMTFTYCILDLPGSSAAQCISNNATITVHVASPVAVDDVFDVVPGTTFTLAAPGVLANDHHVPADAYVQWETTPPAGLTLGHDGSITYPVPADAPATSSFSYCMLDLPGSPQAQCLSNLGTITLRVVPPAATPTVSPAESLPKTGSRPGIVLAVGAVLLILGTVAIGLSRRRRSRA